MLLDFARWDLREPNGRTVPVLRLMADGVPVSDPGTADCFISPIVAAEAAWRVRGERASGSWLDLAHRALDGTSAGTITRDGDPPARVVTSGLIQGDRVNWVTLKLSLAPTGEWALMSSAGLPLASASQSLPNLEAVESDRPLSGTVTDEWALVSSAGLPAATMSDSTPGIAPVDPRRQLSGDETAEWSLVREAIEAAGPPKGPTPEPKPAGPPATRPLSGTGTHEWSFAGPAGIDTVDE